MRTKLVILDWAGTSVDYGCFAPVNAFDRAFRACGIEPTVDEIREPMGMLKLDHIKAMLNMPRIHKLWLKKYNAAPDDAAANKIYSIFEESLMQSLSDYAAPKPDTLETIKWLRAMGISIGSTTGYTDAMMEVVSRSAAEQGYKPDALFTPDAVGGLGRPYPYMIYANMRKFDIAAVSEVIKVGDTISDIKEGLNAGVCSLGILEGSSVVGLSENEYAALADSEKKRLLDNARQKLIKAGATDVLLNLGELPAWIEAHG